MTEIQQQLDITPRVRRLIFDAHDLTAWDSGLLTFVREVVEQSTSRQMVVDQRGLPAGVQRLMARAMALDPDFCSSMSRRQGLTR
jgi:phospholipid/cholesterol/gamma-HCH transport system permease protein